MGTRISARTSTSPFARAVSGGNANGCRRALGQATTWTTAATASRQLRPLLGVGRYRLFGSATLALARLPNVDQVYKRVHALQSVKCRCGSLKPGGKPFCPSCYHMLPKQLRTALWALMGDGYEEAYDVAAAWIDYASWHDEAVRLRA